MSIISGLNGVPFFGYEFADKLRVPCVNASVVPLMATRAFANLMWPLHWRLGGTYNLLTHRIAAFTGWQLFGKTINHWRQTTLNLPPISSQDAYGRIAQMPMLFGISPLVLPKPIDWPDHFHVTGYWFLPRPIDWTPPDDLVRFLDAGEPPVCFSFGSMTDRNSAAITQIVIAALKKTRAARHPRHGVGRLASDRDIRSTVCDRHACRSIGCGRSVQPSFIMADRVPLRRDCARACRRWWWPSWPINRFGDGASSNWAAARARFAVRRSPPIGWQQRSSRRSTIG